jgi:zinc protease
VIWILGACHRTPSSLSFISEKTGVGNVKKFTLKNKMPVIFVEDPESKVVTLDVWVNTGSAIEPKEINGVSHFLEHMMFKGTAKRGVGRIDAEIESVGGLCNAGTSIEFTHYYLTVGAPFVDVGIDTLSDVIANATLDPRELEKERQVILEEFFRQQDDPSHFLTTEAFRLSFQESPNQWPVLGVPETINAITREKLYDYYTRRYAPGNMVLVIVGGVKKDDLLASLEEKFGGLERPFEPDTGEIPPTVWNRGLYREFPKPVKEAYILMTFPAPDLSMPEKVYACDILSIILGEGRSSRLYRIIKEEKKLASSISSHFSTHRRDGLFLIYGTFDYTKKDDLIPAIAGEMNLLRDKKCSAAELQKAKRMLTNHYIFSQETTNGRSGEIGFYYTLTGDTRFEETYLQNIQAVSAKDVHELAREYLNPENANIFILGPEKNGGK